MAISQAVNQQLRFHAQLLVQHPHYETFRSLAAILSEAADRELPRVATEQNAGTQSSEALQILCAAFK